MSRRALESYPHTTPSSPVPGICRRSTLWLVAAAVLVVFANHAHAQAVEQREHGLLAVTAVDVPLERLLAEFSKLIDLNVTLRPEVSGRKVTVKLDPLPPVDALWRVLLAADVDAVLAGGGERPVRVIVGNWEASQVEAGPTRSSVPLADSRQREPDEPNAEPIEDVLDDDGTSTIRGGVTAGGPASGESSTERLVRLLAPTGQPKIPPGGLIPLPFNRPDGQPYTVQNSPPPPGIARLPFPDAAGNPLEIVIPPSPAGQILLPFPGPDGRQLTIPARSAPAGAAPGAIRGTRPGGGPQ